MLSRNLVHVFKFLKRSTSVVALASLFLGSPLFVRAAAISGRDVLSEGADAWPTFHGDSARTGFASGSAPHRPMSLWNFSTDGAITSSPVVANGSVYVQSQDGFLYALNQSTGHLEWQTMIGGEFTSSPVVYGDSVYATSARNSLYRVNASTGGVVWSVPLQNPIYYSPIVVNGRIYATSEFPDNNVTQPGELYCFDASTGGVIWNFTLPSPTQLAYSGGLVYVGTSTPDGYIYALNATTGWEVWSFRTGYFVVGGLTVSGGVLYGGSTQSSVHTFFYALNASTGGVIWSRDVPVVGPPAVAYGRLYTEFGAGVGVLNQSNGAVLWWFQFRSLGSVSIPAVADGLVFVGGGGSVKNIPDPTIYCLDAFSGRLVWYFLTHNAVDSSPAIADGTVYIGASDGVLYAIANANPAQPVNSPLVIELLLAILLVAGGGVLGIFVLIRRRTRFAIQRTS